MLKSMEAAASLNESMVIRYVQFYYIFLARLFRIAGCIRLVVEGLLKETPVQRKLSEFADEFQGNPQIAKYGELGNLKEIGKIQFYEGSLTNSPEMVAIRNSRLLRMFSLTELQLQSTVKDIPASVQSLIAKSNESAADIAKSLASIFGKIYHNLLIAVQPKRQILTSRTERFRDAYCIESPEFYCRDNMKLIEKIERMKMKNMGSRKQLPAESELVTENHAATRIRDRSPP